MARKILIVPLYTVPVSWLLFGSHDLTKFMTIAKTVKTMYHMVKTTQPAEAKTIMEDVLPAHAHRWTTRTALAFKAAVLHLKNERLPITGPTDEKTLYKLLIIQSRLDEAMINTGKENPIPGSPQILRAQHNPQEH